MELKIDECFLRIGKWIVKYESLIKNKYNTNFNWKIDAFKTNRKGDKEDFSYTYINETNEKIVDNLIEDKKLYDEKNAFNHYSIYMAKNNYKWIEKRTIKNKNIINVSIDDNWSKWSVDYDSTETGGTYAFEYLHKIFAYSVLNHGGFVLHGVLMENNGKGIIISAPSGTGKTTHARMWRDIHNALIINGDRALCSIEKEKWTGYGMPWCGTSGEYINRKVPITAIVVLEQGEENSVEKLTSLDGFIHMLQNLIAPTWEESLMIKGVDQLKSMIEEIPVFKLKCTPDEEAVEVLKREIDKL